MGNFSSCWNSNNAYPRLLNVLLVFFVILTSSYFGGCNLTSLSGCFDNSLIVYKSALSILVYYAFSTIFEISFKSFSWNVSHISALSISVLLFVYTPDNVFVAVLEVERYLAFLWLLVQGLIIIDIAHEVHLYIIKQAELAYNFRGAQAAKPWYIVHMVISVVLLTLITGVSYLLLIQCGRCIENKIAIGMTLSFALLSMYFSVSEQCNKGILIPSIICSYSLLLCCNAVLSNPNTSCNSLSMESLSDLENYWRIANILVKWLLLLTSMTSIVYAAVTGSPSLVWTYRCVCHFFLSLLRGDCIEDSCCVSISATEYHLELGLERDSDTYYYRNKDGKELEESSMQQKKKKGNLNSQSTFEFEKSYQGVNIIETSSSRAGGEQTFLLSDHDRLPLISSNPDYSPCSSKAADDLGPLSTVLSNMQLGLAACNLAMLLCDWTERDLTGRSDTTINRHKVMEAMYIKLIAGILVWILYIAVLVNSYHIYRQHNLKLRTLINV